MKKEEVNFKKTLVAQAVESTFSDHITKDDIMLNSKNEELQNQGKQTWEELDQIRIAISTGIVDISRNINDAILKINAAGIVNNDLVISINGFKNDIESFIGDLVRISSEHKGKTGYVTDGDDLALCLSLFNDYVVLNERFSVIIFPAVLTITENLDVALKKIASEQEKEPAVVFGKDGVIEGVSTVEKDENSNEETINKPLDNI